MSFTKKDIGNKLFDASIYTLGAVAVSMLGRKLFKYDLGVSSTPQGIVKLVAAMGGSTIPIEYLQEKKLVPDEPFK